MSTSCVEKGTSSWSCEAGCIIHARMAESSGESVVESSRGKNASNKPLAVVAASVVWPKGVKMVAGEDAGCLV